MIFIIDYKHEQIFLNYRTNFEKCSREMAILSVARLKMVEQYTELYRKHDYWVLCAIITRSTVLMGKTATCDNLPIDCEWNSAGAASGFPQAPFSQQQWRLFWSLRGELAYGQPTRVASKYKRLVVSHWTRPGARCRLPWWVRRAREYCAAD